MLRNQTQNYTQYDPEAAQSEYYVYAIEIMNAISKRFPKGAINQVDVVKQLKMNHADLVNYLTTCSKIGDEVDNDKNVEVITSLAEKLDAGNCGTFANYAIGYMQLRYPNIPFECMFLDDHAVVVIGRPAISNPKDIRTWGKKTLICDGWAPQIYLSDHFADVKAKAPDIKFYALDKWKASKTVLINNDWNKSHYLDGRPEIYTGKPNEEVDRLLVAWVKIDEKQQGRQALLAQNNGKSHMLKSHAAIPFELCYNVSGGLFSGANGKVKIFDIQNQVCGSAVDGSAPITKFYK